MGLCHTRVVYPGSDKDLFRPNAFLSRHHTREVLHRDSSTPVTAAFGLSRTSSGGSRN